jgi:RluA family pseudouridine synthase
MQPQRHQVRPEQAGMPLQDFLARQLNLSRNKAKDILDQRMAFVNGRRIWMTKHTLARGDVVEVIVPGVPSKRKTPPTPIILFQDNDYLVVNKAPGRLSNGPDSLEADLRAMLNQPNLQAVHRLDRDTSGCILIARSKDAFDKAVELFKGQKISKVYHALAAGQIKERERQIEYALEGEPAITHLHCVASNPGVSHLKVKIETGRTHQIRKHLAYIGHPVLGDRTYASRGAIPEEFRTIERQMLHAASLTFTSPISGQKIRTEAPLPRDFISWLKRLGLR